jgi:excinuclease ABC subunit C
LQHFGSAKAISAANLTDIAAVEGVSATLARKIFDFFHPA